MAKIPQQQLEDHILNGQLHTMNSLRVDFTADEVNTMQIDRTLQKLRRKGKVKFHREGRRTIWQTVATQTASPTSTLQQTA